MEKNALSSSCKAKNAKILMPKGLYALARSKLPRTISEKLADSPLLGGISPVASVSKAGMGWLLALYISEYRITPAKAIPIKRVT
jgi:hypothetical protein